MDKFKIGKGVQKGCMLSPCLFNLYAENSMWNAGLDESQAGIKIARRNTNNLRYADDNVLMAESKETQKSLMNEGEGGERKSFLKTQHSRNEDHGIWSCHFMANRWRKSGNSDRFYFIFLFSKITVDSDYSHKIKDGCSLEGKLWQT